MGVLSESAYKMLQMVINGKEILPDIALMLLNVA